MRKNILYFLAGVIVTIIVGRVFINYGKQGTSSNSVVLENTSNQVSFEDKEKCMKYYDTYKNYLTKEYEGNIEKGDIFEFEMFYNSELDTCLSAYGLKGIRIVSGETYKDQIFKIVDYLDGEKELYTCRENPHLFGVDKNCEREWKFEKEKYRN